MHLVLSSGVCRASRRLGRGPRGSKRPLHGLLTMRVSLALRADLPAMANQICAFGLRQISPTGKSLLIFRTRVKPRNQKYSAFAVGQISATTSAVPGHSEGRFATLTPGGSGI